MDFKQASIVVLVVAVLSLVIFQSSRETKSAVFTPSAMKQEAGSNRTVRLVGRVAAEGIDYSVQPEILLRFKVAEPGGTDGALVPVVYRGLRPDMFAPGRDVILDGSYDGHEFNAAKLLTQCPSKYEPPSPGAPHHTGVDQ